MIVIPALYWAHKDTCPVLHLIRCSLYIQHDCFSQVRCSFLSYFPLRVFVKYASTWREGPCPPRLCNDSDSAREPGRIIQTTSTIIAYQGGIYWYLGLISLKQKLCKFPQRIQCRRIRRCCQSSEESSSVIGITRVRRCS
jgi:hypothetical protein